ncbi:MAG: hypothetical protein P1U86_00735 [Verrucomicrobiales bacterium]|nr:hypothetical protein [Verrucomicrobiales bacterium]
MIHFFQKRPWIWVIVAFIILMTGWAFLLRLSITHLPESIPPKSAEKSEQP